MAQQPSLKCGVCFEQISIIDDEYREVHCTFPKCPGDFCHEGCWTGYLKKASNLRRLQDGVQKNGNGLNCYATLDNGKVCPGSIIKAQVRAPTKIKDKKRAAALANTAAVAAVPNTFGGGRGKQQQQPGTAAAQPRRTTPATATAAAMGAAKPVVVPAAARAGITILNRPAVVGVAHAPVLPGAGAAARLGLGTACVGGRDAAGTGSALRGSGTGRAWGADGGAVDAAAAEGHAAIPGWEAPEKLSKTRRNTAGKAASAWPGAATALPAGSSARGRNAALAAPAPNAWDRPAQKRPHADSGHDNDGGEEEGEGSGEGSEVEDAELEEGLSPEEKRVLRAALRESRLDAAFPPLAPHTVAVDTPPRGSTVTATAAVDPAPAAAPAAAAASTSRHPEGPNSNSNSNSNPDGLEDPIVALDPIFEDEDGSGLLVADPAGGGGFVRAADVYGADPELVGFADEASGSVLYGVAIRRSRVEAVEAAVRAREQAAAVVAAAALREQELERQAALMREADDDAAAAAAQRAQRATAATLQHQLPQVLPQQQQHHHHHQQQQQHPATAEGTKGAEEQEKDDESRGIDASELLRLLQQHEEQQAPPAPAPQQQQQPALVGAAGPPSHFCLSSPPAVPCAPAAPPPAPPLPPLQQQQQQQQQKPPQLYAMYPQALSHQQPQPHSYSHPYPQQTSTQQLPLQPTHPPTYLHSGPDHYHDPNYSLSNVNNTHNFNPNPQQSLQTQVHPAYLQPMALQRPQQQGLQQREEDMEDLLGMLGVSVAATTTGGATATATNRLPAFSTNPPTAPAPSPSGFPFSSTNAAVAPPPPTGAVRVSVLSYGASQAPSPAADTYAASSTSFFANPQQPQPQPELNIKLPQQQQLLPPQTGPYQQMSPPSASQQWQQQQLYGHQPYPQQQQQEQRQLYSQQQQPYPQQHQQNEQQEKQPARYAQSYPNPNPQHPQQQAYHNSYTQQQQQHMHHQQQQQQPAPYAQTPPLYPAPLKQQQQQQQLPHSVTPLAAFGMPAVRPVSGVGPLGPGSRGMYGGGNPYGVPQPYRGTVSATGAGGEAQERAEAEEAVAGLMSLLGVSSVR